MFLDFYFSVICYLYRPLFFFLEYIFTLPETHFSLLINRKSETRKRRSLLLLDLRLNISSHSTPFSLSLWWIFCWIRCQLGMIHLAPAAGSIPDDPEDRRETWFPPQIGEKKNSGDEDAEKKSGKQPCPFTVCNRSWVAMTPTSTRS